MTVAVSVDWTQVLIVGVPAYIAALGACVATIISALNRRSLRTPSGDPIGHVVERGHEASVANNLLLRAMNGETKEADPAALRKEAHHPPSVPDDQPPPG